MTISGRELFLSTTSSLVGHDKFYPTKIAVPHHQLRHLVTVAHGDKIYYVNGHDVFVLDLRTHESTLLATIPFEARCLAAGHGYVCVGGEQNGDCAFIRLNKLSGTTKCFDHEYKIGELSGEIVNSMDIHLLRDEGNSDPEPVVLISNNDRTVKVFSLAQREVLATLNHDAPMNFATLSPDSTLLAAVGDSSNVYFYQRRKIDESELEKPPTSDFPKYDWRPFAMPAIPVGDDNLDDHGFAVVFSPSGNLCAASSQGGVITVFDVSLLREADQPAEDAILCSFRSSRSGLCGCVRSMAFSPQPWDLLAWAEDHGRIGIADVRQMFIRRQIMKLDRDKASIVAVEDTTPEIYKNISIPEKLKQQKYASEAYRRGAAEVGSSVTSAPQTTSSDGPRRYRRSELMAYHYSLELDERERSVVDALDTTMTDVEHQLRPYSVHYATPPRFRPSHLADPNTADMDARLLASSDGRTGYRPYQPRRRTSVVLSDSPRRLIPPDSPRARISASPGRMTDEDDSPPMSTNDLTPARAGITSQPRTSDIPAPDPWSVIQTALETARRTDETSTAQSSLQQIEAALAEERALGQRLDRQLADEHQLSMHLRRQLDSHSQILQTQRRELGSTIDTPALNDLSLDGGLRRELTHEHRSGESRALEIAEEIRIGHVRARGLESVRERLLHLDPARSEQPSASTAHSSALPTTTTSSRNVSSSDGSAVSTSAAVRIMERARRERIANIEDLQRQVRRAEARVQRAGADLLSLEAIARSGNSLGLNDTEQSPTPNSPGRTSYQFLPGTNSPLRPPSQSDRSSFPSQVAASRATVQERLRARRMTQNSSLGQSQTNASPSTTRATRTTSELAGRVSETEMRLARMMMFSSGARNTDGNGNWVAGGGLHRILAQAAASGAQLPGGASSMEDVARDVGIGTAGIGWSEDGRSLFAGSEEGIFEFKVNLRDRMVFPAIDLR